jgi:hypothetical protein
MLLFSAANGGAQTVHCQLTDPEKLKGWEGPLGTWAYELRGNCKPAAGEAAPPQGLRRRTDRLRFWPKEDVAIFVGGGPKSEAPWRGHFVFDGYTQSFEIVPQRIASDRLVLRTAYNGWVIVEEWRETTPGTAALVFRLNYAPATSEDVEILTSALKRLPSIIDWDRQDDRNCGNDDPGRLSLYCLLAAVTEERMGRYHHSQPAFEVVRSLIGERWSDRLQGHALMNFNNHAATTLDDLRSLLEASIERARVEATSVK